jgi:hypothetical protein
VKSPKIIETNVLPEMTHVRLYEETIDHVREEHPEIPAELPSILDAVTNAVQRPTHVERSYSNSVVFVDSDSTDGSGNPLRVPLKHVQEKSGRVKTFYFASTEDDPEIIWRRDDEHD